MIRNTRVLVCRRKNSLVVVGYHLVFHIVVIDVELGKQQLVYLFPVLEDNCDEKTLSDYFIFLMVNCLIGREIVF